MASRVGRQNNSFLFELLRFDAGVAAAFGGGEDPGTSSASQLREHSQFVRETQSTCTMVPNVSPSSGGEEKRLQEALPITPSRRRQGHVAVFYDNVDRMVTAWRIVCSVAKLDGRIYLRTRRREVGHRSEIREA